MDALNQALDSQMLQRADTIQFQSDSLSKKIKRGYFYNMLP